VHFAFLPQGDAGGAVLNQALSPDGRLLAYTAPADGATDAFVLPSGGGAPLGL
jgi:hypothetical protein